MTRQEAGRPLPSRPLTIHPAAGSAPKVQSARGTLWILLAKPPRHGPCPPGHSLRSSGRHSWTWRSLTLADNCPSHWSLLPPLHRAHSPRSPTLRPLVVCGLWEVLLSLDTGTPTLMKFQNETHLGKASWLPGITPMAPNPTAGHPPACEL